MMIILMIIYSVLHDFILLTILLRIPLWLNNGWSLKFEILKLVTEHQVAQIFNTKYLKIK